ncbi:histidine phosphatase family protein [Streptomyces sp. ST2-7A]|uniref:histidine phosphatase family protein n=1 Tax=Streptomyces sp. ST2-7A TaxID=2907214 RepID=UPI001F3533EF|nr:histidine phosphatase family protein [Streptomyces sp. ST2-7A]MCE7082044.1 histidine phosphatase family protein [Streptomyces sp. ST2-7A]
MTARGVRLVHETHAITTDNEAGVVTGWRPGRLSRRGREVAVELGARRRGDGISAVFVSDLARAVTTARIAFAGTGIPIHRDARPRECDHGSFTGRPVAEVAATRRDRVDRPYPGGESVRGAVWRVGGFLADLAVERDGQRLLVIGHAVGRWALEHLVRGRPLEEVVAESFEWRPGWEYRLSGGETGGIRWGRAGRGGRNPRMGD